MPINSAAQLCLADTLVTSDNVPGSAVLCNLGSSCFQVIGRSLAKVAARFKERHYTTIAKPGGCLRDGPNRRWEPVNETLAKHKLHHEPVG